MTFECCGIRCTEQSLCEIEGGSVMVTVAPKDVRRVRLRHGVQAPHPLLQVVMGVLLIGFGYFPATHFVHFVRHGGVFFEVEALIIPLVFLRARLVARALKRGHFLEVEEATGVKRLLFQRTPSPRILDGFLADVERCYGFKIERDASRGRV
jgi:hypothetical protein